jgi:predicted ABC-type ATPase
VIRVEDRVATGGPSVPEDKVRARFARLWAYVTSAIKMVDEAFVHDNTRASKPFRILARLRGGHHVSEPTWPAWAPEELRGAGIT